MCIRDRVILASEGLSHAEIVHACIDTIKDAILSDKNKISAVTLSKTLYERHGKKSKLKNR